MPIESVQPFEVRVERRDGAIVLEFLGEFDLTVGEEAASALADAVSDVPPMIVVNLQAYGSRSGSSTSGVEAGLPPGRPLHGH